MLKKLIVCSALAAMAGFQTAGAATILYSDDFNTDTSGNYTQVNGTDVLVEFAYDYSAATIHGGGAIPVAPNTTDSSKKGLRMQVNLTNGARTGVNVYTNQSFSGNYIVDVDVFFRVNGPPPAGGTGSTEYYRLGINHSGTKLINFFQDGSANNPQSTDGYWFQGTGDAGAAQDYVFLRGDDAAAAQAADGGVFEVSGNVGVSNGNGTDPFNGATVNYYGSYPYPGCTGDNWLELRMEYNNGIVTVYMDGNKIAVLNDPLQRWTSGKVCLGMEDTFVSIAPADTSYVLFDNLRVTEIPTPPPPTAADGMWALYD
ncbi:MAG: hypothetical protein Kow0059_06020 [Candidatus Sumerlaeia bacterium]